MALRYITRRDASTAGPPEAGSTRQRGHIQRSSSSAAARAPDRGGLLAQTRIQRRVVLPCRFGPNDHPLSFDQLECARAALMPPQQFRSNIDDRPSFVHPSA